MESTASWSPDELDRAATFLATAERVAVLTGAGISAESGVPTFRGADGLWEGQRIEDVATPRAFRRDPSQVWRFYHQRRANLRDIQPNPGHHTLARMEERWGDAFALITQNVDGLHRAAGNQRILELHGNLRFTRCTGCETIENRGLDTLDDLPTCGLCGQLLRPNIVWFEEMLPKDVWETALMAVHECDCLLVVGTSAVVYPAASLVPLALRKVPPAKVIEINLNQTAASGLTDVGLYGPSGEILPRLWERINHEG